MLPTKLASVCAAVVLVLGLGITPAQASGNARLYNLATNECLDFRADPEYGVYTTGCNGSLYQTWYLTEGIPPTAMRQASTRLCLVARNGQDAMKECMAIDRAALWVIEYHPNDATISLINNVTGTCLGAGSGPIHQVSLAACSGGASQRWDLSYP